MIVDDLFAYITVGWWWQWRNFTTAKKELEQIEQDETNSLIFRSKIRWTEEGEKALRIFWIWK